MYGHCSYRSIAFSSTSRVMRRDSFVFLTDFPRQEKNVADSDGSSDQKLHDIKGSRSRHYHIESKSPDRNVRRLQHCIMPSTED